VTGGSVVAFGVLRLDRRAISGAGVRLLLRRVTGSSVVGFGVLRDDGRGCSGATAV